MAVQSTLYTLGGYAAIIAVLGVYWFSHQQKGRPAPAHQKVPVNDEPLREKGLKKKKEVRAEQARKDAKDKPRAEPTTSTSPPAYTAASTDDDIDNREFARQISKLKEGTKFVAKSGTAQQKKAKYVKQSSAEVPNFDEVKVSAPSSTAGIDADDDQSPAASPRAGPATATAGDISDMLEAPAPGPASLRLVDVDADKSKPKPKAKTPEPTLTKKQRQNKKKAEAAKAANQEAEAERKIKMEAQRRTAREAEGRLAKDGSQFTNAAVNAWKSGAPSQSAPTSSAAPATEQLLDTFDEPAVATTKSEGKSQGNWMASLPSEEAQMEMIKSEAEAEEWSTVKKSKKTKKSKSPAPAPTESKEEPETSTKAAAAPTKPQKETPVVSNGKVAPKLQSRGSAFSALPVEGDDDEEEEWDI